MISSANIIANYCSEISCSISNMCERISDITLVFKKYVSTEYDHICRFKESLSILAFNENHTLNCAFLLFPLFGVFSMNYSNFSESSTIPQSSTFPERSEDSALKVDPSDPNNIDPKNVKPELNTFIQKYL